MLVIGVDAATRAEKNGIAAGTCEGGTLRLIAAFRGTKERSIASEIHRLIEEHGRPQTLIALDAPLGWPIALGASLSSHSAGAPLLPPAAALFSRETDRAIETRFGKRPLEVGANFIARTACAALGLLVELRGLTGRAIPLAWTPSFAEPIAAIEVYPTATLRAHALAHIGYRRPGDRSVRGRIIGELNERGLTAAEGTTLTAADGPLASADVLDAIVCVLAGADFIAGECPAPQHLETARGEGWIWARQALKG